MLHGKLGAGAPSYPSLPEQLANESKTEYNNVPLKHCRNDRIMILTSYVPIPRVM